MRKIEIPVVVIALGMALALPSLPDDLTTIQKALNEKYSLTTTTADRTDIVTAGSVLVLKKSNLLTTDASKTMVFPNTYKNGRITQSKLFAMGRMPGAGMMEGTRTFVSGEKVWVTGIEVREKEIEFDIYTDAFSDVRYRGKLNFPFEKGSTPTVSGAMATVAEVFDVQQADPAAVSGGPQPPPTPQKPGTPTPTAGVETPPAPIAPPPPPPADPKEIKLGQTPDQVTANIGQPDKVIKLGAKQIYVYKDMKVIFVGGKVSDVQ